MRPFVHQVAARRRQYAQRAEAALDGATLESTAPAGDAWDRHQRALTTMAELHAPLAAVDLRDVDRRLADGGQAVTGLEALAFEAIILQARTPVFRVRDDAPVLTPDAFDDLPATVRDALAETPPSAFTPALRATARIDIDGAHTGTGFLVGDGWMLTNRHVARTFAFGLGTDARLAHYLTVTADFGRERSPEEGEDVAGPRARVTEVAWIHPYWDAALLRVEGDALAGRAPITLRDFEDDQAPIAVVGFPAFRAINPEYDALQRLVFGGVYGVKRFAPGRARGVATIDVPGPGDERVRRRTLHHDASTLGGSSGSLVLLLADRGMVGLHFAGWASDANYAVPVAELVGDTLVRASQVHVTGALPDVTPRDDTPPASAPSVPAPSVPALVAPATPGPMATRLGPLAYVDGDERALAGVWADADRPALLREIATAYGPVAAEAFARKRALSELDGALEGARRAPRGVIVFAHGIMGSNLRTAWGGDRVWLDPLEIVFGDVASRLTVRPSGPHLLPAGHLAVAYWGATLAWEARGFEVVPFSYDWRRSIEDAAPGLDAAIEAARAAHPGVPVTLVCHSMGGVVAAYWAATHPDRWRAQVAHVALVGVPLAGSYAPMEAVNGDYDLLQAIAGASARNDVAALRIMAASMPGLVDLMPHVDVFPDAAALSSPEGWGPIRPAAASLAGAARVHAAVATSPLVPAAHVILGDLRDTAASLVVRDGVPRRGGIAAGDGTVPARSASRGAVAERLYVANRKSHAFMFHDADVIDAIEAIAAGAPVRLPRWAGERARAGSVEAVRPSPRLVGAALAKAVRAGSADGPTLFAALFGDDSDAGGGALELEDALEATGVLEPSGPAWLARYPIGTDLGGLAEPFRSQVTAFVAALKAATGPSGGPGDVSVEVRAARCPVERVMLLQGAWDVAHGALSGGGLPIDWTHGGDAARAQDAARAMCDAAGLDARPPTRTRFTEGLAVRLEITWTGLVDAHDADGAPRALNADAGQWDNPALVAMGRTYGVRHRPGSPNHWSFDGR